MNNHQQIINRLSGIINLPARKGVAGLMGDGVNNVPSIYRCFVETHRHRRQAGLPETEFKLTNRFMPTVRRKPVSAFDAVAGKGGEQATPPAATGQVTGEVAGEVTGEVERVVLAQCRAKTRALKQDRLQELVARRAQLR